MSSDSHATISYTLMSSYEVIVNRGDDDADDDGDDLSEDDGDDEDEEESLDSKEEHLALTVSAPALHRTPLLLPIPLPTSSFPLPLSLPSTSGSESVPEADMPLRKRARFTTPTGGYELGESSIAAAAR
nr:hypothetical protein [Tanacetum cinerariifolium]